jgi:bifunctional DNA-binding transcriptional regulator/antitoxin component of YhaV-PrlF toxin-antitoxin module
MKKIKVVIELGGKNATGFEVPEAVVTALGKGRKPPVTISIGDYQYRSTIATMGGRFMVPVSAEVRKATGVAAGDEVEVKIELDTQPREVSVPDDFASALDGEPEAKRRFESLSYSHKRQHVTAIDDAKTAETRKRRIDKAIAMLKNP